MASSVRLSDSKGRQLDEAEEGGQGGRTHGGYQGATVRLLDPHVLKLAAC